VADASDVTEPELEAILGNTDPVYGEGTKVTASVSGSVLTITVVSTLQTGIVDGEEIPGSHNPYVTDILGNPQRPSASPPTLPPAP
jgi:hypothetical protein